MLPLVLCHGHSFRQTHPPGVTRDMFGGRSLSRCTVSERERYREGERERERKRETQREKEIEREREKERERVGE